MTLELPKLLDIDWSNYAERIGNIYDVYLNEIYGKLSFFGKPVHCRIIPIYDNKHECFWHLMTQDFEKRKIKDFQTYKKSKLIFQILYLNSSYYLSYLKLINKETEIAEYILKNSMKNKELLKLLSLEKSLVYFTTSLK